MITPPFSPVTGQAPHAHTAAWDLFVANFTFHPRSVGAKAIFTQLREAAHMHPDILQRALAETARVNLIRAFIERSPIAAIAADFARLDHLMQGLWVQVATRVPALESIAREGYELWL